MLLLGIPRYRLPREIIDREVAMLTDLGVEFRFNTRFGQDVTLAELKDGFAFDSVPTNHYAANSAWQQLVVLAHNEPYAYTHQDISNVRAFADHVAAAVHGADEAVGDEAQYLKLTIAERLYQVCSLDSLWRAYEGVFARARTRPGFRAGKGRQQPDHILVLDAPGRCLP